MFYFENLSIIMKNFPKLLETVAGNSRIFKNSEHFKIIRENSDKTNRFSLDFAMFRFLYFEAIQNNSVENEVEANWRGQSVEYRTNNSPPVIV